jgi:hypothetical protein
MGKRYADAQRALERLPAGWTADVVLRARIFIGIGQPGDAIRILRAANENGAANDHPARHVLEEALFRAGRYEEALALSTQLFAEGCGTTAPYNACCSCCRLGRIEEALMWLERAIDGGWSNRKSLESDPDLAAIRESAAYPALLSRIPAAPASAPA